MPNPWIEATSEEIEQEECEQDEASNDTEGGLSTDLGALLQADLLHDPGKDSPMMSGMKQMMLDIETEAHSRQVSAMERMAKMDATLERLLALQRLEGEESPPIISNASADQLTLDPFEMRDVVNGYREVVLERIGESEEKVLPMAADGTPYLHPSVHAVKAHDDENPTLKQALQSDKRDQWKEALHLDLKLMEDHGAIKLVPFERYHECVSKYGKTKVDIKHIVYACKVKRNAKGVVTKFKVRGCVGDATRFGKVDNTYSATVAPSSRKLQAQLLALHPEATSQQNDVQGAYYCGTPVPYDEGGRVLFCFIPAELEEFGYSQFDDEGRRQLLEIVGNLSLIHI